MPPRKGPKPKPVTSTRNLRRETRNGSLLVHAPSNHLRALRNTMAPSPEIVSEIFILALPTNQELYSMPQFYDSGRRKLMTMTPVFCAVCSSWRSLALATPRLWNGIFVHVPRRINKAQLKRKVADLVQWISRSRSLPLTLHLSGDIANPPNGEGPKAPIISVIKDHAARWESLYFRVFQPSSSLLHLDGWHSLRRLYYPCFDPVSCTNEIVPWAHLTHLQIWKYIPCQDAVTIFMKCPKLVYLSILVVSTTIGQTTVPIILQDLVTFYIKTYWVAGLQTLLHQLSLPSLREISIYEISSGDIEPLVTLFTRSSCTLDRLEICGDLESRDYLDVLAHSSCNSLTSLSIRPSSLSCAPVDEEVLQRLTLHRNDTMCSHLSFLTIDYCIPTSLLSALLNMAESRIKCAAGQVPEEPALRYLRLHLKYLKKNAAELDKVGRRSRMEYSREKFVSGDGDGCFSVWFQRQGFGALPNFDKLFWA